jgi:hypothetical protein
MKQSAQNLNDKKLDKRVPPNKKLNKSPYEVGVRRLVTPSSQKQKRRANASNPKYLYVVNTLQL